MQVNHGGNVVEDEEELEVELELEIEESPELLGVVDVILRIPAAPCSFCRVERLMVIERFCGNCGEENPQFDAQAFQAHEMEPLEESQRMCARDSDHPKTLRGENVKFCSFCGVAADPDAQ